MPLSAVAAVHYYRTSNRCSAKSILRNILPASHDFSIFYPGASYPSASKSNSISILRGKYKKNRDMNISRQVLANSLLTKSQGNSLCMQKGWKLAVEKIKMRRQPGFLYVTSYPSWFRNSGHCAGVASLALCVLAFCMQAAAQTPHAKPLSAPTSDADVAELQDQLLKLIRLSPTLAEVVARDPSLLSNTEYVSRNNPQLESFLQAHPEIAVNPDFYLFNNLHGEHEPPSETLERKLWPQPDSNDPDRDFVDIINASPPFLIFLSFLSFLGAFLWLIHVLLENRRWGRIFKLQNDVHGKLIEKFGTSQEMLAYMSTEAGKKFLEATPLAVGFERQELIPSPVARVLLPLQIGLVMTLLGAGLIGLGHSEGTRHVVGFIVIGTVILMPGLGFIISAGITWVMARRLGLMPERAQH